MDQSSAAGARWWPTVASAIALLLLLVGAASDEASAQAVTGTPAGGGTVTATPTFQWVVRDQTNPGNVLHVDPFQRRFQFDVAGERETPTVVSVPNMQKTQQRVTWKWSDVNRPCETPTPDPSGSAPAITPTPGRCPVFVWATLDRVRKHVRATLFQRTTNGHMVSYVVNRPTPLPLPRAPDPAVLIQDFQLQPKRKIIQSTDQLSFQNNTNLDCTITFNPSRPPGQIPADPSDSNLGTLPAGRVSRLFPKLLPTPTPTPDPLATPLPKPDLWKTGEYVYNVDCGPISLRGSIVVQGAR